MSKKDWRYKLEEDFILISSLLSGIAFESDYIKIRGSIMEIKKGYAWDGCSPTFRIPLGKLLPQGIWLGTWDGPVNTNGLPVSFYPSLVHDALCQYRYQLNITKEKSVELFRTLLIQHNAPDWFANLYSSVVNKFGPQDWYE